MSTIKSSATTFYVNGSKSSAYNGYYGVTYSSYGAVFVTCFDFTTDSYGASSMDVSVSGFLNGAYTSTSAKICYYISNYSDTSYANKVGGDCNVVRSVVKDSTYTDTFTISNIALSPNTSYKLWVFPYDTTVNSWPMKTSASVTFETVPLASSISATNVSIGGTSTITIKKASSSFTHTVTYNAANGTKTGTIATKTGAGSVTLSIPTSSFVNCFSSTGTSFNIVFTCDTYNGSSKIGSSTCTITVSGTQAELAPSVSYNTHTLSPDRSSLTGAGKLILNAQSITVKFNVSAKNGTSLSSVKISNGKTNKTASVSGGIATATFDAPSNAVFVCNATDYRGYSNSVSYTAPSVNYFKPTYNVSITPPPADGTTATMVVNGSCFNGSLGIENNTLNIVYKYKTVGGEYGSETIVPVSLTSSSYSQTINITDLNYQSIYVFYVYIQDKYGTVGGFEYRSSSKPMFYWDSTDFYFNNKVHFDGGVDGLRDEISRKSSIVTDTYVIETAETWYDIHSISGLEAGTYMVIGSALTRGSVTGYYLCRLLYNGDEFLSSDNAFYVRGGASKASASQAYMPFTCFGSINIANNSDVIKLQVWASKASMECNNGKIMCMKIR